MDGPRLRARDELLDVLAPHAARLDLRRVDWVRPALMVGVAALAHRTRAAGRELTVAGPLGREPAGYAARMRLGSVLDELGVRHDLPDARPERDRRDSLVELSVVDGEHAAIALAELVHGKLRAVDRGVARALHASVAEIGANVPEHSQAIGYMAAVTLPRRNELLLAVGDAGVGMRATLAHRGAVDDESAIDLATTERVSRLDGADRGRGLPSAVELVTGRRGSLYIATGAASIREFATTRRFLRGAVAFPGTLVEARIPLS